MYPPLPNQGPWYVTTLQTCTIRATCSILFVTNETGRKNIAAVVSVLQFQIQMLLSVRTQTRDTCDRRQCTVNNRVSRNGRLPYGVQSTRVIYHIYGYCHHSISAPVRQVRSITRVSARVVRLLKYYTIIIIFSKSLSVKVDSYLTTSNCYY